MKKNMFHLNNCELQFALNIKGLKMMSLCTIALAFGSVLERSANNNHNCQLHLVQNTFLAMFMYKSCFYWFSGRVHLWHRRVSTPLPWWQWTQLSESQHIGLNRYRRLSTLMVPTVSSMSPVQDCTKYHICTCPLCKIIPLGFRKWWVR